MPQCDRCQYLGYAKADETGRIVLRMHNGDTISGIKKLKNWTYYCTATPGIRKIKFANDWSGQENPKWCPKRKSPSETD
jgi:hypothetical protein